MKDQETDYLDKLFASSSDLTDEVQVDFPLVEVPESLDDKLCTIAERTASVGNASGKPGFFKSWPRITSTAASLLVAIVGFQFYQQQQTLQQLEQAQNDLATALHYLGEANRITQEQLTNSLNDNIKNAELEHTKEIELETKLLNRTL